MTHRVTDGEQLLEVSGLARVEGEGAMRVVVRGGEVTDVQLRIYEPPRFFEAFLRGRAWTEPPDITARICGICPVAYQMSSCLALEAACGVTVGEEIRQLRRLLYCGEWLESHALHIYFLHAPDFLGYESALEMARDHRDVVERALRLKKAGNALMTVVGGRAVHPVNVRLGGFYRLPTRAELRALRPQLQQGLEEALATVALVGGFDFPEMEQPYAVGPLARYTLCSDQLSPVAQEAARAAGLGSTCRNPFQSIVVRAVEVVYAFDEALRIIDGWEGSGPAAEPVPARAGEGHGATEAPRGLLYHRYRIADDGTILEAQIVPPTSQNQAGIEGDLRAFVATRLDLSHEELTRQCEQVIRNYDPCISCATHFLDLQVVQA